MGIRRQKMMQKLMVWSAPRGGGATQGVLSRCVYSDTTKLKMYLKNIFQVYSDPPIYPGFFSVNWKNGPERSHSYSGFTGKIGIQYLQATRDFSSSSFLYPYLPVSVFGAREVFYRLPRLLLCPLVVFLCSACQFPLLPASIWCDCVIWH